MKAGWKLTTLGDSFTTVTGNTPPKNNGGLFGSFMPLVKPPELCDAELDTSEDGLSELGVPFARTVPPNSILVSCIGNLGKIGLNTVPVAFNQQINAILPDARKALPRFMFFQVLSCTFKDQLESMASGTTVPIVNKSKFNSIQIVLPPLSEQKRIVTLLDEVFAHIATAKANAEQNLQNARALFAAGFSSFATATEQDQWSRTTVEAIAAPKKNAIRTGPFGSQLLHGEFVDAGIAVLGIDNAVSNEFRWGKSRFISIEKYKQLERYKVYPGDVLITIMGTCGRCAVVPDDIPIAINTKHLCCITTDWKKCLPSYLHAYFLYHPIAQDFLIKHAKGSIMAGLNMGLIQDLPLLLPAIDRQQEIVERLNLLQKETQRLESIYQQKLSALDALKKSLLHQTFSGQL